MLINGVARTVSGRTARWLLVVVWIVLAGVAASAGSKLTSVENNDAQTWLPGGAQSLQALNVANEHFGSADVSSAISAGLVVVLAALTAREMGARRDGQIVAAVVMASGGVLSGTGHLLDTSMFDLLAWAWIIWLVVRLLRTGDNRLLPTPMPGLPAGRTGGLTTGACPLEESERIAGAVTPRLIAPYHARRRNPLNRTH